MTHPTVNFINFLVYLLFHNIKHSYLPLFDMYHQQTVWFKVTNGRSG